MATSGFRFLVSDSRRNHSSVWRIFFRKSDIYLSARSIASKAKISLHESGIGRFALTSEYERELQDRGRSKDLDRKLSSWKMPDTPEGKIVHVLNLCFPLCFLQPETIAVNTGGKECYNFVSNKEDSAVSFGLFYSKGVTSNLEEKLTKVGLPIFRIQLDNQLCVSLAVREESFNKQEAINNICNGSKTAKLQRFEEGLKEADGIFSAFFMNDPDLEGGVLKIWDFYGISFSKGALRHTGD